MHQVGIPLAFGTLLLVTVANVMTEALYKRPGAAPLLVQVRVGCVAHKDRSPL